MRNTSGWSFFIKISKNAHSQMKNILGERKIDRWIEENVVTLSRMTKNITIKNKKYSA
jgi:hypothetical protein